MAADRVELTEGTFTLADGHSLYQVTWTVCILSIGSFGEHD